MKKIIIILVLFASAIINGQDDFKESAKSSMNFIQPISVTIGGNFIVTGSFTASKTQRVDHFVTTLFNEAKSKAIGSMNDLNTLRIVEKELKKFPLRDIILKRNDGEILKIDLLMFRLTGDFKYNPYLKSDDVIIFPSFDDKRDVINISGAVNKPASFQFVEGDRLADALLFAGGLSKAYENVTEVEISRVKDLGKSEERLVSKISDNVELQRGDRITVLFNENHKVAYKVLVLGEVNRPGEVYILKNNSTLRDVISKAGGFTSNADLRRAELLRGSDQSQIMKIKALRSQYETDSTTTTFPIVQTKIEEILTEGNRMIRSANLSREEVEASLAPDLYLRMNDGRGILDFNKVMEESSEEGNTIVHESDVIIIPSHFNYVYVFGQVKNPGYYSFESNKDWRYYINKAGGVTERAKDEEEIRVINGISKTWYDIKDKYEMNAGDYVYVPKSLPKDITSTLQIIGTVSNIVATIVTLTFIILQASK